MRVTDEDELQVLIDDLAEELGRSVIIDDPLVRILCASRHFGDEDELRVRAVLQRDAGPEASSHVLAQGVARWTGPGIVPGRADLGMRDRLCVPLRERGELLGLLMVIDAEHTLTPRELAKIQDRSRTAAAVMRRRALAHSADRTAEAHFLLRLLHPDAGIRAEALAGGPAEDGPVVAVSLRVRDRELPDAESDVALHSVLESAALRQRHRVRTAVRDGHGTALFSGAATADVGGVVERMAAGAGRLLDVPGAVLAGIGAPAAGLGEAWRSYRQAEVAVRGAGRVPGAGAVVRWADLGPYAMVLQLPAGQPGLLPAAFTRLAEHEKADRLLETLRAFLEAGGSIRRTADALHLHRTSLYYRLDQIRAITGLDLDDGGDRLQLHLSLLLTALEAPAHRQAPLGR
ncbi:helix-turn-helix domain-containing protein [Amycolatopsis sp. NPDC005961]|uniref:PucR family transcriptional regulator n=1 Tax=Amycolatopsis sp. NPDC005961 TaxID=3156720 RepID=UPI0033FE9B5E